MAGEEGHLDCLHPGAYDGNPAIGRIHLVLQALQGEAQAADDRHIEVHKGNFGWLIKHLSMMPSARSHQRHERWSEDPLLGDDAAHQFQRRGIKGGIVGIYARRRQPLSVQHAYLLRIALFNGDIRLLVAGIECGKRRRHIEGYAVMPGQDGVAVGSDLVEDGIFGDSVRPHYDPVYPALSHQAAGHAIADECHRYPVLGQLPGS